MHVQKPCAHANMEACMRMPPSHTSLQTTPSLVAGGVGECSCRFSFSEKGEGVKGGASVQLPESLASLCLQVHDSEPAGGLCLGKFSEYPSRSVMHFVIRIEGKDGYF